MFRNHTIQMKLVKPDPSVASDNADTTAADLAYIMSETSNQVFKGIGAVMLAYVAADTVRKVIVHTATVKIV